MGILQKIASAMGLARKKMPELCTPKQIATIAAIALGQEHAQITLACNAETLSQEGGPHSLGCIVLGEARHFSIEVASALKKYAAEGLPIVLALSSSATHHKSYAAVKALLESPCVACLLQPRAVSMAQRLSQALANMPATHVFLFTLADQVNRRSMLVEADRVLAAKPKAKVFLQPRCSCGGIGDDLSWRLAEWDVTGLSGLLFQRNWLVERVAALDSENNFWLARDVLVNLQKEDLAEFTLPVIAAHSPRSLTPPDIAALWRDWRRHFLPASQEQESKLDARTCEKALTVLQDIVRDIREHRSLTIALDALLLSFCAQACALVAPFLAPARLEEHKYQFSSLFNFDQLAKNKSVQDLHGKLAEAMVPVRENCLAIIESEHMEDLREALLPLAREKHEVIYLTKPQYYDYHFFNCLVLRWQLQPARFVVSSNDMHAYITGGKPFLALWHGLGMLKEIATPDRKVYPMDWLVASSTDCVPGWSRSFALPANHILPLGQIQTDRLFDPGFVQARRQAVRDKYGLGPDARLAFFAPTFRMGEPKYYDFGIDIDSFARELKTANVHVLAKRHHVFASILRDKDVDTSGLRDAENGFFRVDEECDFVSLLCAADVFMTDYSSGLFYAVILNMPFVLYATDAKEYAHGPNGFMIRYPDDLPGEFVGQADAKALAQALAQARERRNPEKYAAFREHHLGACDGHAGERVLRLLEAMLRDPEAAGNFAKAVSAQAGGGVSHAG